MPGGAIMTRPSCVLTVWFCLLLTTSQLPLASPVRVPGPKAADATATATTTAPLLSPNPTPTEASAPDSYSVATVVRPKPEARPFDNPAAVIPKKPAKPKATPVPGPPRLDDPILRW